jgi:glycosyltransferase involved in cell wall biosynthesis
LCMHIYYDYQIFALQNVGGISRYFVELASRLPERFPDIKTTVLAPIHINGYLGSSSVDTIGRRVPEFPGKHHVLAPVNLSASRLLLKRLKPDIFHETYYSLRSQSVSAPRVLTVYDMIHERFPAQFHGPDLEISSLKAAAVARADHIITISCKTREDLIKFLAVPSEKITVIPLASSFDGMPEEGGKQRQEKPYLLYVGLRQGVKNFSTLLTAYGHSKMLRSNFDLLCVGGGNFTPSEVQALQDGGLGKQVKHVQASDALLATLYSQATLFVYPSLYEGFGLPLLEAMRCGCPVVCSGTSSMPEIAGDAALYFDPVDEEEMRTVIEQTVQSEKTLKTLRMRGYEREQLFSWESCVAQTAELYRSLL